MQRLFTPFAFLSLLFFGFALATPINVSESDPLSNTLSGEIEVYESVFFENYSVPESKDDDEAPLEGKSEVKLGGSGSVTVISRFNDGFPKLLINSGTTITSYRWLENIEPRAWWNGGLKIPRNIRAPKEATVEGMSDPVKVMTAYAIGSTDGSEVGLVSEQLTFYPAATFALAVDKPDGSKVWIASRQTDGSYAATKDNYCIIENGICGAEFTSGNYIALAAEGDVVVSSSGNSVARVTSLYRGEKRAPYYEITDNLSPADKEKLKKLNFNYYYENPNSTLDETIAQNGGNEKDGLLNYMWSMRQFFNNDNSKVLSSTTNDEYESDGYLSAAVESSGGTSSGGDGMLLPSTGVGSWFLFGFLFFTFLWLLGFAKKHF